MATLNPDSLLATNTECVVGVTTGVKDREGNRLDQNRTQSNYQQKVWIFTTGSI